MSRPDLLALAERVERAAGPDRALDETIYLAVGAERLSNNQWRRPFREKEGIVIHGDGLVPYYTGSLDTALSLLPARHDWSLHADNGEAIAGCQPASEDGCDCADCRAATPALALLAAILRARAAMEQEG
jgi:hypothetical protein